MPKTILTNRGVQKITSAAGSQSQVQITHIALGDGLGVTYEPSFGQTALKRERARQAIEKKQVIGKNAWRVKAEFGTNTPAFWVREIGFFDQGGDLIALWAGVDVDPRQTGAITYLIDHVLTFSRVEDGLVIVTAPDDEVFDLAVATATATTNLQSEQLRQADQLVDVANLLTKNGLLISTLQQEQLRQAGALDETFALAVATATAFANLQHEQLRQADELRALSNRT